MRGIWEWGLGTDESRAEEGEARPKAARMIIGKGSVEAEPVEAEPVEAGPVEAEPVQTVWRLARLGSARQVPSPLTFPCPPPH